MGTTLNPGIPDGKRKKRRRETGLLWDGKGGLPGEITGSISPSNCCTVSSLVDNKRLCRELQP